MSTFIAEVCSLSSLGVQKFNLSQPNSSFWQLLRATKVQLMKNLANTLHWTNFSQSSILYYHSHQINQKEKLCRALRQNLYCCPICLFSKIKHLVIWTLKFLLHFVWMFLWWHKSVKMENATSLFSLVWKAVVMNYGGTENRIRDLKAIIPFTILNHTQIHTGWSWISNVNVELSEATIC